DTEIDIEGVDTVGGLLAHALGRVPIAGSEAVVDGLRLTAETLAGRRNRIGTVVVRRVEPTREDGEKVATAAGDREQRSGAHPDRSAWGRGAAGPRPVGSGTGRGGARWHRAGCGRGGTGPDAGAANPAASVTDPHAPVAEAQGDRGDTQRDYPGPVTGRQIHGGMAAERAHGHRRRTCGSSRPPP